MTITETDYSEMRRQTRQIQAERNAQERAEQIRGALDGELYITEDGELFTTEDGESRLDAETTEPVDFYDWLNMQLEMVCLYNKDGEPQQVTVLMEYGGPTSRTEGDYVIWGHGQESARSWVGGLHDALLELHEPLELRERY